MTATLSAVTAITKIQYPGGKLPSALYKETPYISTVNKNTEFKGKYVQVALQNERPQGVSARFPDAIGSLAAGSYLEWNVYRTTYYGLARISGEAMKAVEGDNGALVDLWKNECDGASAQVLQSLESNAFGNGDGIVGTLATGSVAAGTTITLTQAEDVVHLCVGERIQFVNTTGLSPTLRTGSVQITAIVRGPNTATLTVTPTIAGIATDGDGIVRAGDYASGGTGAVITGLRQMVVGGSSPGTLFGLNRDVDPTRLAGLTFDAAGYSIDDAIVEASGMIAQQGGSADQMLWINTRDGANWRKSLMGRVTYPRVEVKSTVAGIGFKAIEVEGDNGVIKVMTSPFCPRNKGFLINPKGFVLRSMGPAPQLLNWDSNSFLRVSSDDAYEIRFGFYGNHYTTLPQDNCYLSNLGA